MVTTADLISYWKLDESSGDAIDAHDSHDCGVYGATQGVTGKINNAYSFDGVNDYIYSSWYSTGTVKSISFWAKSDNTSFSSMAHVIDGGGSNGTITQFNIRGDLTGDPLQIYASDGSNYKYYQYDNVFTDTNWHFFVMITSGNTISLYKDGSLVSSTSSGGSATGDLYFNADSSNHYGFGRRNSGADRYFAGDLDEVGMWSKTLTSSDVSDLWNDGDGLADPFNSTTTTHNAPFFGVNF